MTNKKETVSYKELANRVGDCIMNNNIMQKDEQLKKDLINARRYYK